MPNVLLYLLIGVMLPIILYFLYIQIYEKYLNVKFVRLIKCVARKELITLTSSIGVKHLLNRLINTHKLDNLDLMEKFDMLDSYYKHRQFEDLVYEDLDMLVLIGLIMMIVDDRKSDKFYMDHLQSMVDVLHVYEIELTTHKGVVSKILHTMD